MSLAYCAVLRVLSIIILIARYSTDSFLGEDFAPFSIDMIVFALARAIVYGESESTQIKILKTRFGFVWDKTPPP
jgi:hypothetical protein